MVVDHVVPVAKGGTDDPENLVCACSECNLGKSDIGLDESRLPLAPGPAEIREQAGQIAEYLDACKALDEKRREFRQYLTNRWCWAMNCNSVPNRFLSRLMSVVSSHGLDIFNAALDVVTAHSAHLRGEDEFKYFNGVVKRMVSGG